MSVGAELSVNGMLSSTHSKNMHLLAFLMAHQCPGNCSPFSRAGLNKWTAVPMQIWPQGNQHSVNLA